MKLTPGKLAGLKAVSDERGTMPSPTDAGMPQGHAAMTEVRVELEDLGGRTKMVLTHVGIPSDSPGAAGWTRALDKLASYIAARAES